MPPLIEPRDVRLDVFGSAARGTDFDPTRSDVDLLVTYKSGRATDIGGYLARRVGRPVDLVVESAVVNAFIRAGIERSRQRSSAAAASPNALAIRCCVPLSSASSSSSAKRSTVCRKRHRTSRVASPISGVRSLCAMR